MNRKTLLYCSFGAAIAAGFASKTTAADFRTSASPVEGQYIVVFKPEAARMAGENGHATRVTDLAGRISAQYGFRVIDSYEYVLRGFSMKADDAALARLLADPRVDYVEENGVISAPEGPISAAATQLNAPWGLDRIDQRQLPLSTTYTYNTLGAGVHAYIIDSGIVATHPEFGGRVAAGFTAINDGFGTHDCNGNGTNIAGVVGAKTWGVAKDVTLHPVRVLDCAGTGTLAGILSGMNWVAAARIRPAVASMSLSGTVSASLDNAALQLINTGGVSFVVTAGGRNADACNFSPGRVSAAITVGATDRNDVRVTASNYGGCLDLFAPGTGISSISTTTGSLQMAPAHVAGAVALYLFNNPAATPAQVSSVVVLNATGGAVINPGPGSPNRLLYTLNF